MLLFSEERDVDIGNETVRCHAYVWWHPQSGTATAEFSRGGGIDTGNMFRSANLTGPGSRRAFLATDSKATATRWAVKETDRWYRYIAKHCREAAR